MHILGQYGKDNAAAICDLFLECMPGYPLDKPDAEGNTGRCNSTVTELQSPSRDTNGMSSKGGIIGCSMLNPVRCKHYTRSRAGSLCNTTHTTLSREVSGFSLSVLLLAYMKGNANLCRAIVRAGARLGVNNNQGVNIFNYQVATKQLLFRLLGKYYLLQWEGVISFCF